MIERAKLENLRDDLSHPHAMRLGEDLLRKAVVRELDTILASPESQGMEMEIDDHDLCHANMSPQRFGLISPGRWRITAQKIAEPERTWRVIVVSEDRKLCEKCGKQLNKSELRDDKCYSDKCGARISGEITWEAWREEK